MNKRFLLLTAIALLLPAVSVNAGSLTLPAPRVVGPTQVHSGHPLSLRFTFPPQHWSYQSFWHLWYWAQYWHCEPGKNSPPTPMALNTEPWPGHPNPCTRDDNRYLGLGPNQTQETIRVPKQGGVPATGTWYVRVRLVWKTNKPNFKPQPGPWSRWHRVAVVQGFKDAVKAPRILAPRAGQVFAHQDVSVRVAAAGRHPNPARWEYAFQWQRAEYHTKADNALAKPRPRGFPRVLGQASPFHPWLTRMSILALPENASVSTMHLSFAGLRSGHHDSSYIYRFRVRERLRAGKSAGPWSGWRSFIVTDPVIMRPMAPGTMRRKTH